MTLPVPARQEQIEYWQLGPAPPSLVLPGHSSTVFSPALANIGRPLNWFNLEDLLENLCIKSFVLLFFETI